MAKGSAPNDLLHLPILRFGKPYKSLDAVTVLHHRTREPLIRISQANIGLIRRDMMRQEEARAALAKLTVAELVAMSKRAAGHFLHDDLPLDPDRARGDGGMQSPETYVEQLSATTGMPHVMVRRNMLKVHGVLSQVDEVLGGLTRGLDLVGARRRHRPGGGTRAELLPARRVDGRRAAEQLAGRAFAVGAGDGAQDAADPEAGQRRAVDAVSHGAGVAARGLSARGVQLLSGGSCRRQRDPAAVRPRHGVRRRLRDRSLEGRSADRASRPGLQQGDSRSGRGRRTTSSIST